MHPKYAEKDNKQYNSNNLKNLCINYLVKEIIYSKDIKFTNHNTNHMITKFDKFFITAQKDNYEMIYVIIIFNELIKIKDNYLNLIEFLINRKIHNNQDFIFNSEYLFFIICLIVGKNYDDDSMLNKDYHQILKEILKENYTQKNINIMEYKILTLMNFHFKLRYLDDFFDYYKMITLSFQ